MGGIKPDWWKRIFDETYLITDARSVCDERLTFKEVDFLEQTLNLDKSWSILDLCGGQGRHSLELSRRGFQDVTVLDYSEVLIDVGKERAEAEDLNTRFVRCDARKTNLPDACVRIVIVMASSFGYFEHHGEDQKILREVYRLLKPMGKLLLDLPDRAHVHENFIPQSWHEANEDIVVCRQRRLADEALTCREMVISKTKGLIRDETYRINLYSREKIEAMLKSAGFERIFLQKDGPTHDEEGDYGCMTNRMIVIAQKDPYGIQKKLDRTNL
jgi:D-alanine-D-alanine ligase